MSNCNRQQIPIGKRQQSQLKPAARLNSTVTVYYQRSTLNYHVYVNTSEGINGWHVPKRWHSDESAPAPQSITVNTIS
jgi:hypothetical protein